MKNLFDSTRVWLDGQDGYVLAAYVLFAFVALVIVCSIINGLAKVDRPAVSRTRAVNSSRKASRSSVVGGAR